MNCFYALYHGDTFITVADTIQELAEYLHESVDSARWMSYPSAHRKFEGHDANLIYKYEE